MTEQVAGNTTPDDGTLTIVTGDEENPRELIVPPPGVRQDAFHALGTEIPEGLDTAEALEYANMANWNVRKEQLTAVVYEDGIRNEVQVPNSHAVIRTSPFTHKAEVLGIVGNRWTPFQNEAVAGVMDNITAMSGARLKTALVLNGGRKTGLVMEMPEGMTFTSPVTGAKDVTKLNLVLFNSHDASSALSAVLTPIRLFCANQQRMAESTATSRFMLRHTGEESIRMAQLEELLSESFSYQDVFTRQVQAMIDRSLDEELARIELEQLFHAKDVDLTERQRELRQQTVDSVFSLYMGSETVAPFRGTAYGIYNAVTEYTDHVARVIVPDGDNERNVRAMRTLESAGLDDLKARAFDQLVPA